MLFSNVKVCQPSFSHSLLSNAIFFSFLCVSVIHVVLEWVFTFFSCWISVFCVVSCKNALIWLSQVGRGDGEGEGYGGSMKNPHLLPLPLPDGKRHMWYPPSSGHTLVLHLLLREREASLLKNIIFQRNFNPKYGGKREWGGGGWYFILCERGGEGSINLVIFSWRD